jgi:hypothetical protein
MAQKWDPMHEIETHNGDHDPRNSTETLCHHTKEERSISLMLLTRIINLVPR